RLLAQAEQPASAPALELVSHFRVPGLAIEAQALALPGAQVTEAASAERSANRGGRNAERLPERISEVAMAGEAELQRQPAELGVALGQALQGLAQAQTVTILMDAEAGDAAKQSRQMV